MTHARFSLAGRFSDAEARLIAIAFGGNPEAARGIEQETQKAETTESVAVDPENVNASAEAVGAKEVEKTQSAQEQKLAQMTQWGGRFRELLGQFSKDPAYARLLADARKYERIALRTNDQKFVEAARNNYTIVGNADAGQVNQEMQAAGVTDMQVAMKNGNAEFVAAGGAAEQPQQAAAPVTEATDAPPADPSAKQPEAANTPPAEKVPETKTAEPAKSSEAAAGKPAEGKAEEKKPEKTADERMKDASEKLKNAKNPWEALAALAEYVSAALEQIVGKYEQVAKSLDKNGGGQDSMRATVAKKAEQTGQPPAASLDTVRMDAKQRADKADKDVRELSAGVQTSEAKLAEARQAGQPTQQMEKGLAEAKDALATATKARDDARAEQDAAASMGNETRNTNTELVRGMNELQASAGGGLQFEAIMTDGGDAAVMVKGLDAASVAKLGVKPGENGIVMLTVPQLQALNRSIKAQRPSEGGAKGT